jgi:hypothetical protein
VDCRKRVPMRVRMRVQIKWPVGPLGNDGGVEGKGKCCVYILMCSYYGLVLGVPCFGASKCEVSHCHLFVFRVHSSASMSRCALLGRQIVARFAQFRKAIQHLRLQHDLELVRDVTVGRMAAATRSLPSRPSSVHSTAPGSTPSAPSTKSPWPSARTALSALEHALLSWRRDDE